MRQVFTVLRWSGVGVGILLGVGSNALNAYQIILLGLPSSIWTAIAFAFFAAGLISLVLHYRQEKQPIIAGSTLRPTAEVVAHRNKLIPVIKAIIQAERITPKGMDITVYITDANGLSQIYPEELKSILLKLQDDEKVLILKTFPDWLLSSTEFTKEVLDETVLVALKPQRKNFTIRILKNFEGFAKRLYS